MNLLLFYNICGVSGRENVQQYIASIYSFLRQVGPEFRVVISGCLTSTAVKQRLQDEFKDRVSYCWTDSKVPVNISFNNAVGWATEHFGPMASYMYLDCGVDFGEANKELYDLCVLHTNGPYAMTAARVDNDLGSGLWFGLPQTPGATDYTPDHEPLFANGHLTVPIGKTVNLHCQLFDHSLVEAFGRPLPDVFASQCTESIFSFMCAAVGRQFVVHKHVIVTHHKEMDGGSSGFWPHDRPGWSHVLPESWRSMEAIIADPEARESGMGYEECQSKLIHDAGRYDSSGKCLDPDRLRWFIADNFFLLKSRFRYRDLKTEFLP